MLGAPPPPALFGAPLARLQRAFGTPSAHLRHAFGVLSFLAVFETGFLHTGCRGCGQVHI